MDWLRIRNMGLAVLALAVFAATPAAYAAYRSDEILVKYRSGKQSVALSKVSALGGKPVRNLEAIRTQLIKLPKGLGVQNAVGRLKGDPNIEYVGPNHIVSICIEPNDEYFMWLEVLYMQWGLYSDSYPDAGIDAPAAWDITTGSSSITIAVVDTGVDLGHEDLYAKIVPGRNVITGAVNPSNPQDDHGHGTFVSGVAAAMTNNFLGVAGVSWGAKVMPIKALDQDGYGTEADAAAGIIWAADNGAHIINMSFGGYDDVPVEQDAVAYAWGKGCVLVGASGNDGASQDFFPAAYDQVLAVGASNESAQRCTDVDWGEGGSNYGQYLDLMAPGNSIMSTAMDGMLGGYDIASGTSAATPFVSGIAALLMSEYPQMSNLDVTNQIKYTCKDMETQGWDEYTGWGLASAYQALATPPLQSVTLSALNLLDDGALVKATQAVLTCSSGEFPDRLYIEQEDRASGIMAWFTHPPSGLYEGDVVEVVGRLSTTSGERSINSASFSRLSSRTPLLPLGMSTRSVGGSRLGEKPGVDGGIGLNNSSLLVTTWGRVTAVGWTYFYIDEGCNLFDGSGLGGLKVMCDSMSKPPKGKFVRVTGISSCEQPSGSGVTIPVVRVRRQSDMTILF